jgi:UDP-N-acetylmuramoyl-tripeptide--D-alanyl-D-alanine ligase
VNEETPEREAAPEVPEHPWSIGAIARMTRATVAGVSPEDWRIIATLVAAGVSLDSRHINGGEVFVALQGSHVDGHDFIGHAFDQGAAAVLARRSWWSRRKAARAKGIHFLVDDPRSALQEWGAALRGRIAPRVLAITGSSGKTSTKEMALALLRPLGGAIGTVGNRNNDLGLPWSLLQLHAEDRWAVIELGANHPGEIVQLTRMARPDVALITCIGRAHIGPFGSPEQILAAKLEILEGLSPEGAVVIPDDDPRLAEALAQRWSGRVVRFGLSAGADVRATGIQYRLDGTDFELTGGQVHLQLLGEAGVRSALAALAGVQALGAAGADPARLGGVAPLPGRLDPLHVQGKTWILDMYNASPESVLHGLSLLEQAGTGGGRKVFVFGGMRELGEETVGIHQEIGRAAGRCDAGVFLGEEARHSAPEAQKAGVAQVLWSSDPRDAIRFLKSYLLPGDVIYLKGARAAGLEELARAMGVIGPEYGGGEF